MFYYENKCMAFELREEKKKVSGKERIECEMKEEKKKKN